MKKFKVDFIGIGADRSGTTWLSDCLREHPETSMTDKKELYFFNKYDQHLLKYKNPRYKWGIEWYKKHFNLDDVGKKVIGEYSSVYLYGGTSAKRIKEHFPKTKIIVSLRDPVTRAFSKYLHDIRLGVINDKLSFEQALEVNDSYVKKGKYYSHLKEFYSRFPKKNILVIIFEDIAKNPKKVVKEMYKFIGLKDIDFEPSVLNKKVNVAVISKSSKVNSFLINTEFFIQEKEWNTLYKIIETLNIRRLAYLFSHFVNQKKLKRYPKIKPATERKLRSTFKPDILKLEKLTGKNLNRWKKI